MWRGFCLLLLCCYGCTTIALSCPDGKSTLTYRGTNLLSPATTAASCTSNGAGPMASITGTDLSQLAAMVAKTMAASQGIPSVPVAAPTPAPEAPKAVFIEPPPGCYGDGNVIECPEPWTPPIAI